MFQRIVFQSKRCLFQFWVLARFVKHFFKVCEIFLLSLIVLWFSWEMKVFAVLLLLEKKVFSVVQEFLTVFQNFLVSVVLLGFKLLKYCFLHVSEFLHVYSFTFCNFVCLHFF